MYMELIKDEVLLTVGCQIYPPILIKDEVLLTVSCPIFPSILIAKNLLTGSLKNRYEFSSAFIDQRLPNLVQRLFADVIYDAIWLMNIHEQKYL